MIVFTNDADPPSEDRTDAMNQAVRKPRPSGTTALVVGAVASLGLALLAALAGWLLVDRTAGLGALVGALVVVVVASVGTILVNVVAGLLPSASLLVALLTYSLQLMLVVLAFAGLERSGWLGPTLDRQWVGGTAIVVMLAWLGIQLLLAVRERIPAFDLRPAGPAAAGREVRSADPEGGEARP